MPKRLSKTSDASKVPAEEDPNPYCFPNRHSATNPFMFGAPAVLLTLAYILNHDLVQIYSFSALEARDSVCVNTP
jgi:hypothetical protein